MAVALDQLKDTTKGKRRGILVSVLMVSVVIHIIGGVGAGIWIVAKYFAPPEATFVSKKVVSFPPKLLDPKMAAAEFEAAAPKPVLDQKIATLRATDFALPDLPKLPVEEMMEFDPSAMISSQMTGLLSGVGAGSGDGSGGGGDGSGSGINFFGIESTGRSVVILFDVSQSVLTKATRAGVSIERIKEETLKLIDGISINTTFGLIQFTRGYLPFKPELIAPTDQNKAAAKQWLQSEFRTAGFLSGGGVISPRPNGLPVVIDAAFQMGADVIYIVADGDFQFTGVDVEHGQVDLEELEDQIKEWQAKRSTPTVIHFIGFEVPDQYERDLKSIARKNDGKYVELD